MRLRRRGKMTVADLRRMLHLAVEACRICGASEDDATIVVGDNTFELIMTAGSEEKLNETT